jgi:Fe-S cluster assembly protein SufD
VITVSEQLATYLDSFTEFRKCAAGRDLPWLKELCENAFARFCEVGFPTTHDEDWRFTNVSAIARTAFELAPARKLPKDDLSQFGFSGAACKLVFVNGHFAPELSGVGQLPAGVAVNGLAQEIASNSKSVESHLGRYLNIQRDAFSALNTAFASDGAYVHVRKGVVLEAPIYLLFVSTASDKPLMTHPRNLIVIEKEAQATIVEDYVSIGESAAFCNTATELVVGENAVVEHYMVEREHKQAFNVSTLRIQQQRSANVSSHSVLLGGGLVRNNVHPVLAGEGGECLINGLFIGNSRQHLDNYMLVEHASPHCGSRQFYNGILDDHAHGVFHGRIVVHKDAQKTDAKQTNRNLLLSDDAQIDTKPQLEIYADDVKCTHGATIGQIEENALFYLRSRGIDEVSARKLLLMAFASECLDRMIPGAAREHVENLIHEHLRTLASKRIEPALSERGDSKGVSAPHESGNGRNFQEVG